MRCFFFSRAISAIVVFCFVTTSVLWGVPVNLLAATPGQALQEFAIPAEWGTIEKVFKGKTQPIFYIQDAHSSLTAQENISKLVTHFVKENKAENLYVEGFEGPLPLDELFSGIDRALKEKTSFFLMDYLRINGAQHAYINREDDFNIVGIEKNQDYLANLKAYKASAANRALISKQLKVISKRLKVLGGRVYPKEVKKFLKLRSRFEAEKVSLADYLFRVMRIYYGEPRAESQELRAEKKYPNLKLISENLNKRKLSKAEEKELNEKLEVLDHKTLFKELDRFEGDFIKKYLTSKLAQKTFFYQEGIKLFTKLNELQITPDQFQELKKYENITTVKLANFLAKNLKRTLVLLNEWEGLIKENILFYELAEKRDQNFKEALKPHFNSPVPSVLVTGGFHKAPLLQFFKENQVSFVLISPRMKAGDRKHEARYDYLMTHPYYQFEEPFFEKNIASGLLLQRTIVAIEGTLAEVKTLIRAIAEMFRVKRKADLKELKLGGFLPGGFEVGEGGLGKPPPSFVRVSIIDDEELASKEVEPFSVRGQSLGKLEMTRREFLQKSALMTAVAGLASSSLLFGDTPKQPQPAARRTAGEMVARGAVDVSNPEFARQFTIEDLKNTEKRAAFVTNVLAWEGQFHQPGVAYDDITGLTYDGHLIDFDTGELLGGPRNWSAPSKESLHIMLLAEAIAGNPRVQTFLSPSDISQAKDIAFDLLNKKMDTFEKFNREHPGFGGFLPWFLITSRGMKPAEDWSKRVPALDNGQMAWAMLAAANTLKKAGYLDLAARYQNYFDELVKNMHMMFFDEKNEKIRGVTDIRDTQAKPFKGNYANPRNLYHLGNFEGEMFVMLWSLYGGADTDLVEKMWNFKANTLKRIDFPTEEGEVTIRQGWRLSGHEEWPFLMLPYLDDPLTKQIFRNIQIAKTAYSKEKGKSGLYASSHGTVSRNVSELPYIDEVGIKGANDPRARVTETDKFAPYAAFPVIIEDEVAGTAWLLNMIKGPKMQGPYGFSESVNQNGREIGPILTHDGKMTIVQSLANGVPGLGSPDILRDALKRDGKYEDFLKLINAMHKKVFGDIASLKGTQIPLALPERSVPQGMLGFKGIKRKFLGIDVLEGPFQGSARHQLSEKDKILYLPDGAGYLWRIVKRGVDLKDNHFFNIQFKTQKAGTIFLELKNTDDQVMTRGKIAINVPDTNGQWVSMYGNFESLLVNKNTKSFAVAFSDPTTSINISQFNLTERPESGFREMTLRGDEFTGQSLGAPAAKITLADLENEKVAYGMFKSEVDQATREKMIAYLVEDRGLEIVWVGKPRKLPIEKVETFYREHEGASYYKPVTTYINSGEVVPFLIKGGNQEFRDILGKRDGTEEGTLRNIFGVDYKEYAGGIAERNKVHGSDAFTSVVRETSIVLREDELREAFAPEALEFLETALPDAINLTDIEKKEIASKIAKAKAASLGETKKVRVKLGKVVDPSKLKPGDLVYFERRLTPRHDPMSQSTGWFIVIQSDPEEIRLTTGYYGRTSSPKSNASLWTKDSQNIYDEFWVSSDSGYELTDVKTRAVVEKPLDVKRLQENYRGQSLGKKEKIRVELGRMVNPSKLKPGDLVYFERRYRPEYEPVPQPAGWFVVAGSSPREIEMTIQYDDGRSANPKSNVNFWTKEAGSTYDEFWISSDSDYELADIQARTVYEKPYDTERLQEFYKGKSLGALHIEDLGFELTTLPRITEKNNEELARLAENFRSLTMAEESRYAGFEEEVVTYKPADDSLLRYFDGRIEIYAVRHESGWPHYLGVALFENRTVGSSYKFLPFGDVAGRFLFSANDGRILYTNSNDLILFDLLKQDYLKISGWTFLMSEVGPEEIERGIGATVPFFFSFNAKVTDFQEELGSGILDSVFLKEVEGGKIEFVLDAGKEKEHSLLVLRRNDELKLGEWIAPSEGKSLGIKEKVALEGDMEALKRRPVTVIFSLSEWNEFTPKVQSEIEKHLLEDRIKIVLTNVTDLDLRPALFKQESGRVKVLQNDLTAENLNVIQGFTGTGNLLHLSETLTDPAAITGQLSEVQTDRLILLQPKGEEGVVSLALLFASGEPRYQEAFTKGANEFWVPTAIGQLLIQLVQDFIGAREIGKAA